MNRRQLPTHQTIQLTDWRFTGLADVPHFDTALAPRVDVLCRGGHCYRADHLSVGER